MTILYYASEYYGIFLTPFNRVTFTVRIKGLYLQSYKPCPMQIIVF